MRIYYDFRHLLDGHGHTTGIFTSSEQLIVWSKNTHIQSSAEQDLHRWFPMRCIHNPRIELADTLKLSLAISGLLLQQTCHGVEFRRFVWLGKVGMYRDNGGRDHVRTSGGGSICTPESIHVFHPSLDRSRSVVRTTLFAFFFCENQV
jgi:hypothetical protein